MNNVTDSNANLSSLAKVGEPVEPRLSSDNSDDVKFMRMALRQAQIAFDMKEIPIGCVIVKDGVVIGKGYNQVEQLKDATAHAEIFKQLRTKAYKGACSKCKFNDRCGGCRARAAYYHEGDYMQEDSYCAYGRGIK